MSDRSLRGMRLGAQSMETEQGVEPAPRQTVEYVCEDGEKISVIFAADAEIPPTWTAPSGKVGVLAEGDTPDEEPEKPARTHWDMLLERRSKDELEDILQDRMKILRERRGEKV